jgi:hypothetical protein
MHRLRSCGDEEREEEEEFNFKNTENQRGLLEPTQISAI